ncbi:MAG TPA: SdpI family protein [Caulobacteraceae bacterium]|nr:SdpI family protein [Caulobacteraceae bacterium]
MNLGRPMLYAGILTAASFAIGAWAYVILPPDGTIAISWHGFDGAAHSAVPKLVGLAIMPLVALVVTASLSLAPLRARNLKGLVASAGSYGLLLISLAALFLVTQGALVERALNPDFDVLRWVFMASAALLVLIGNTLGKVRHNDVFGVRTPWTLADPRVWDKTQRFTGRLMVVGALILAAFAGFLPDHALLIATLVAVAAGPYIAGAAYSRAIAKETAAG